MRTSNQHWKEYFLFMRFPDRPDFPTHWQLNVAPYPPLKKYRSQSDCLNTVIMLTGQKYVIHKLLLEGILYIFGLSLIRTGLPTSQVEVMLRACLAGKVKLADVVINTTAVEELGSCGL